MACGEKDKSTRVNRDWTKARKVTTLIILEDLTVKEVTQSPENGDIRELSVLMYPANEDSTLHQAKNPHFGSS